MSGGSFNYAYSHAEEFADKLERKLRDSAEAPVRPGDEGGPMTFEPAVTARLHHIALQVRQASALMKEVEWLYSGDSGDESFLQNLAALEQAAGATGADKA
jgi:hypothetical protein